MYNPTDPPQQQPTYYQAPPPIQHPKRRIPHGCIIAIIVIVALGACGSIAAGLGGQLGRSSTITDTQTALARSQDVQTPQDTQPPPVWTTVQTIKGDGSKKTGNITVPDSWKITWTCDRSSFSVDYNVIVSVYNSDSTPVDVAINTLCKKGNTSGETEEHQGGNVYLDIVSEGSFTIKIQELI